MTDPRLTDEALAAALAGGAAPRGPQCPTDTLFWELAHGTLAPSQNAELLDHAAGCAHCTLALHVAQEVYAVSGLAVRAGGAAATAPAGFARRGFGARFLAGVLHPVPAAVYLVLLVGALGWIARGPGPGAPGPGAGLPGAAGSGAGSVAGLVAPHVVHLSGDVALRGPDDAVTPRPVPLAPGQPLVLELFPEPGPTAGGRPLASSTVVIRAGATVVAELHPSPADVDDSGALPVLVPPGTLHAGTTYVVTVERDGRVVFRQTIAVASP